MGKPRKKKIPLVDVLVILKKYGIDIAKSLPWKQDATLDEIFDLNTIMKYDIMLTEIMDESVMNQKLTKMKGEIKKIIGEKHLGSMLAIQRKPKNIEAFVEALKSKRDLFKNSVLDDAEIKVICGYERGQSANLQKNRLVKAIRNIKGKEYKYNIVELV